MFAAGLACWLFDAACRDPATIAYTMAVSGNSWLTAGAENGLNAPMGRGRGPDPVPGITRQLGGHDDHENQNGQATKMPPAGRHSYNRRHDAGLGTAGCNYWDIGA